MYLVYVLQVVEKKRQNVLHESTSEKFPREKYVLSVLGCFFVSYFLLCETDKCFLCFFSIKK